MYRKTKIREKKIEFIFEKGITTFNWTDENIDLTKINKSLGKLIDYRIKWRNKKVYIKVRGK